MPIGANLTRFDAITGAGMNAPLKLVAIRLAGSPTDECEVDHGRACPTIPYGEYKAVFTHPETAGVFKTAKVFSD